MGQASPEVVESNLKFINILLKGTSTDLMSKSYCHGVNYQILSFRYPNEYPQVTVDPKDVSGYASRSGDCFVTDQLQVMSTVMNDSNELSLTSTVTVHCDCNDPENYNFKDEGKF